MRLTDRELRGKPSAEREPGEVELLEAKLVEQIHVMKDVILDGVDRLGSRRNRQSPHDRG